MKLLQTQTALNEGLMEENEKYSKDQASLLRLLGQKDEEIKYLVEQLEYLQSKYKQKKMQLSILKNSCRSEESQTSKYSSKPERDIDVNPHNWTVHDYSREQEFRSGAREAGKSTWAETKPLRPTMRDTYQYERQEYKKY